LSVCGPAFPDWNARNSFLDTAEMSAAVAIGYDWLYEWLTDSERATIRQALERKGLEPARDGEAPGAAWARMTHNWARVTRGGPALAALALGDEQPQLAGQILDEAGRTLGSAAAAYAPDGGFAEGLGYWSYATSYFVSYLANLELAFGRKLPVAETAG